MRKIIILIFSLFVTLSLTSCNIKSDEINSNKEVEEYKKAYINPEEIELIEDNDFLVIFSKSDCNACDNYEKEIAKLYFEYEINSYFVNAKEYYDYAVENNIVLTPTTWFFINKEKKETVVGKKDCQTLYEEILYLKNLEEN